MSFLNSVLSSIGANGTQTQTPSIQPNRPPSTKPGETTSQAPTIILPAVNGPILNNKRKAEDRLEAPNGKVIKSGGINEQILRATPSIDKSIKANLPSKVGLPSTSNNGMPYRGTGRPSSVASAATNTPITTHIDPSNSATDAVKAPKKGSYAEIMARAKASQSKAPAVGVISHKPRDKITISHKKELKMKKNAIKNRKLGIKTGGSRPGSSGSLSSSPAPMSSDVRKAPQPVYKGTAKAHVKPTYQGTMKAGSTAASKPTTRDRDGQISRNRYNEYAATDEDDLDDIEEDEYGSDESEDMEAGFSDVEEEESVAIKAAKKEDENEARLEARLKNEKEERKKRLELMAKKAKPQRY